MNGAGLVITAIAVARLVSARQSSPELRRGRCAVEEPRLRAFRRHT